MSYLAFNFQEGVELHLRGAERHHLGFIVENAACGAIGLVAGPWGSDAVEAMEPFLPKGWIPQRENGRMAHDFKLNFSWSDNNFLSWREKGIQSFSLLLNTAIVAGSDPVALAAKMHGTCETHGYFLGKDRAWLADVIEQGLETNILRRSYWAPRERNAELRTMMKLPVAEREAEYIEHSMGWTEIVEQLRKSDADAVVMSYSITESFPQMPAQWMPEGGIPASDDPDFDSQEYRYEQFGDLPDAERFALAFAELEQDEMNRPISPETLRGLLFRHELTLLDLLRGDIPKIEKNLCLTEGE